MELSTVYEIIGYVASGLIAVSLTMSSIMKLRIINFIGAVCFTVYGFLIAAYPVAGVNLFITFIDLYYIIEIFMKKEYFTLLEITGSSNYLSTFLQFYQKEIRKFLPEFSYTPSEKQLIVFVLRNLVPAGLLIAEADDSDSLLIRLDYVIPGYRDFKIGKFLFSKNAQFFKDRGFQKVYSDPGSHIHQTYLRRMGFVPKRVTADKEVYVRSL